MSKRDWEWRDVGYGLVAFILLILYIPLLPWVWLAKSGVEKLAGLGRDFRVNGLEKP